MGVKGFIAGAGVIAAGLDGATQYSSMQSELKVLNGIEKSNVSTGGTGQRVGT